ncbi:MAG: DUF3047 domain-containing protein [Thermodesulfobacteriota bacterium]
MKFIWLIIAITLLSFSQGFSAENEILLVDRFESGINEKGLPQGWSLEKEPGPKSKILIKKEKGVNFLHLFSVNDTFGLKKEISFDIRRYPYLSWRWRVTLLPKGGDIRKRETDDQAGQIYVIFPKFPAMINSRSVGYIWDTQAPVGFSGISTAYSKMRYIILQSGNSKLNQWLLETRNVYEDYKSVFQEEPPLVGAVLIYINSQHTESSAACDYSDIYFSTSR